MPPILVLLLCLTGIAIVGVLVVAIRRAIRLQQALNVRLKAIEVAEGAILTLQSWTGRWQHKPIPGAETPWKPFILVVAPGGIVLYDRDWQAAERLRLNIGAVRWFGRPQKYSNGDNDIWLHLEQDGAWSILKIRLWRDDMQAFVRALKSIAAPELVTAYRRARPYIHIGPVKAHPATQDIHGAWTLDPPLDLYLMPRFLVILRDDRVVRTLPLEVVQGIGVRKRLDQPNAAGLVTFRAEDEPFAFALPSYELFAEFLADAAKRTLEAPLERKQKGKEDEDYDYDYDEADFRLEEGYDA